MSAPLSMRLSVCRACPPIDENVVSAAWLHDIGHAPELVMTGMHAIDGAAFLDRSGAPREVVSLVAFHIGPEFEAEERGLLDSLSQFDPPDLTRAETDTSRRTSPDTSGRPPTAGATDQPARRPARPDSGRSIDAPSPGAPRPGSGPRHVRAREHRTNRTNPIETLLHPRQDNQCQSRPP